MHSKELLLRAGIMTDTHVTGNPDSHVNLCRAFQFFKDHQVDLLVNLGDVADSYDPEAYRLYLKEFQEIYPENPPLHLIDYAYHDSIGIEADTSYQKIRDQLHIQNGPYWLSKIKGQVILVVPQRLDLKRYEAMLLEAREMASPGAPVFLFEHVPVYNTVYNSHDWGRADTGKILSSFPEVIQITGHVHNSLRNELCIWQGDFTVVNAGTLQIWDGELCGTAASSKPEDGVLIMEVYADRVEFHRWFLSTGKEYLEQPLWVVPLPFDPKKAPYRPDIRKQSFPHAEFPADSCLKIVPDDLPCKSLTLDFPEAENAFLYRIRLEEMDPSGNRRIFNEQECFSQFYLSPEKRSERFQYHLNTGYLTAGKNIRISVTPVNFFNVEGSPLAELFRVPELQKWLVRYCPASPMQECSLISNLTDGSPLPQKDGFFIKEVYQARLDFPEEAWPGKAGRNCRLVIDLETERYGRQMLSLTLRNNKNRQDLCNRIYIKDGKTNPQRIVIQFTANDDSREYSLFFHGGYPGKLKIHYLSIETENRKG